MLSFASEVEVEAPASACWALLTDAAKMPSWNRTVVRIEGTIALGNRLKVFAAISPERAFDVTVQALEPERRMVWGAALPLGMFRAERTFTLTPVREGAVRFAMREEFRGWMLGLIARSMPNLQPSFDEFAASLKRAAERGA